MSDLNDIRNQRIRRALTSLEALAIGDAFGEIMQDHFIDRNEFNEACFKRTLPSEFWYWTDDTAMSIGLVEYLVRWNSLSNPRLLNSSCDEEEEEKTQGQKGLAFIFGRNLHTLGPRQYSNATHELLDKFANSYGENWRKLSGEKNSFGNGSVMRIPPLGAYFADVNDISFIINEAILSSQITHFHKDAIDGCIAITLAAWIISKNPQTVSSNDILSTVLSNLSEGLMKTECSKIGSLLPRKDFKAAADILGSGSNAKSSNTVPFSLWCACVFLQSKNSMTFEELMWSTASASSDVDTICAIVAGMVANAIDDPKAQLLDWIKLREPLITTNWDTFPDNLWPFGLPHKGKGLHPMLLTTHF